MAPQIDVFSLYEISLSESKIAFVLLRTVQPSYSNASQIQENKASDSETKKRQLLLQLYIKQTFGTEQIPAKFIGELQEVPFGDLLYSEKGLFTLPIFYMNTYFYERFPTTYLNYFKNTSKYMGGA